MHWTTDGADRCHAFGSWTGEKATSGSETIAQITTEREFGLECQGSGGVTRVTEKVYVFESPGSISEPQDADATGGGGSGGPFMIAGLLLLTLSRSYRLARPMP